MFLTKICIALEFLFIIYFYFLVTGALSGDLGDLGAHGTGTANAIGLGGTAHGGGMNGLGAGAWGIKGAGGGAMTGALLGTGGMTGLGGLAAATGYGSQMGTSGGMSEQHNSGGAYGLGTSNIFCYIEISVSQNEKEQKENFIIN